MFVTITWVNNYFVFYRVSFLICSLLFCYSTIKERLFNKWFYLVKIVFKLINNKKKVGNKTPSM